MLKRFLLWLIRCYQKAISPLMPARCRYYPTCSEYGRQALLWHGAQKGLKLTVRRVLSCHPWGGSGVDFVPVPMDRYKYTLVDFSHKAANFGVFVARFDYQARLNWLLKHT